MANPIELYGAIKNAFSAAQNPNKGDGGSPGKANDVVLVHELVNYAQNAVSAVAQLLSGQGETAQIQAVCAQSAQASAAIANAISAPNKQAAHSVAAEALATCQALAQLLSGQGDTQANAQQLSTQAAQTLATAKALMQKITQAPQKKAPHAVYGATGTVKRVAGMHGFADELVDADDLCGLDVLGAPPPKTKKPLFSRSKLTKAAAKKLHPLHIAPDVHKSAVKALTSGSRAVHVASRSFHPVVVGDVGGNSVLIGALPTTVVAKKLTPAQRTSVDRYNTAVKKSQSAATAAAKKGQAAVAVAKKAFDEIKNASVQIRSMLARKNTTRMHGVVLGFPNWTEIRGPFYSVGDPPPVPDPFNPGFLTDGTPDPAYGGGYGAPYGSPYGDPNYGAPAAPPDVPITPPPPMGNVINASVPPDGVVYDESKGYPDQGFGSYEHFYPGQLGPYNAMDVHSNAPGDGFALHSDGWYYFHNGSFNRPNDAELADGTTLAKGSIANGWGPLVSNPNNPDLAKLRWSMVDRKWFWYLEEAPAWATAAIQYAASKLAQQQAAADQAAAQADAAAQAKAQADQAAAQAASDAQIALAQQQAASASQIAQQQQADQTSQQNVDWQTQADTFSAAQAQAQLQAAQQQAQLQAPLDAQAQQQALQLQQMQLDYLQQHPELMAPQQQQPDQGQGGGDGGGMPQGLPAAGDTPYPVDYESAFQAADEAAQQAPAFNDVNWEG